MISKVIAGDFENQIIGIKKGKLYITKGAGGRLIDSTTVTKYEVLSEESQKSAVSGVARGIVGGALLGGVGMVAGAVSAKNKGTYQVSIEFVDNKKSLVEVDSEIYKQIVKACFDTGKPKLTAEELAESENSFTKKDKKKRRKLLIFFLILLAINIAIIKCGISDDSTPTDAQTEQAQ